MGMPRQLLASLAVAVGAAVILASARTESLAVPVGVLLVVALGVFARAAIRLASEGDRSRSSADRR
ncbi:MAG TPA: hypothetical protein VF032_16290 [Thermoleophilaceae bacterium]